MGDTDERYPALLKLIDEKWVIGVTFGVRLMRFSGGLTLGLHRPGFASEQPAPLKVKEDTGVRGRTWGVRGSEPEGGLLLGSGLLTSLKAQVILVVDFREETAGGGAGGSSLARAAPIT